MKTKTFKMEFVRKFRELDMKNIAFFLSFGILLSSACKKNSEAGFTADKSSAYIGEPVHFTDNAEYRKNVQFFYDYGDGSTSDNDQTAYLLTTYWYSYPYYSSSTSTTVIQNENSENNRNPTHIYMTPGIFTVTQNLIFAQNPEKGKNKIKSKTMQVTILPIEADFSSDKQNGTLNETFYFTNTTKNIEKSILYFMNSFYWQVNNLDSLNWGPNYYNSKIVPQSGTNMLSDAIISFEAKGTWRISLTLSVGTFTSTKTMDVEIQ
ncbi:MAG: hypothetical protein HYY40_05645 [Bacteroidetes bacterium]|nr:hypothetical protein [Bacteroidota bacterium]